MHLQATTQQVEHMVMLQIAHITHQAAHTILLAAPMAILPVQQELKEAMVLLVQ